MTEGGGMHRLTRTRPAFSHCSLPLNYDTWYTLQNLTNQNRFELIYMYTVGLLLFLVLAAWLLSTAAVYHARSAALATSCSNRTSDGYS